MTLTSLEEFRTQFRVVARKVFDSEDISHEMWYSTKVDNDSFNLLICLRQDILQAKYLELEDVGTFATKEYQGKWVVLVGDGLWDGKIYETEEDARDGGFDHKCRGYPPVVFTVHVGNHVYTMFSPQKKR
jgi:hypothetical protein